MAVNEESFCRWQYRRSRSVLVVVFLLLVMCCIMFFDQCCMYVHIFLF